MRLTDAQTGEVSLIDNSDPAFDAVMEALSAKDELPAPCATDPDGPPPANKTVLVVFALTPDSDYRVRLPAGFCGGIQAELAGALNDDGVKVGAGLTTS
ncbi:MAG: hypothetical protein ABI586_01885 [Candidatus Nanopelagicales bacterium]